MNKYIKLEDVLALIPTDDIVWYKPSHFKKLILNLPFIEIKENNKEKEYNNEP